MSVWRCRYGKKFKMAEISCDFKTRLLHNTLLHRLTLEMASPDAIFSTTDLNVYCSRYTGISVIFRARYITK